MLHILLLILKWIALILGGIIGLLLLLLLLVLFVPLRYRMRLVSGEEGITGRIQADWLLRAFGITADYRDGKPRVRLKLFWLPLITLYPPKDKGTKHQGRKKQRTRDGSGNVTKEDNRQADKETTGTVDGNRIAAQEDVTQGLTPEQAERARLETELERELLEEQGQRMDLLPEELQTASSGDRDAHESLGMEHQARLHEKRPAGADYGNGEQENKEFFRLIKKLVLTIWHLVWLLIRLPFVVARKIRGFFQKLGYTIRRIYVKICHKRARVRELMEFLRQEETQAALDKCKRQLFRMVCHAAPRKLRGQFTAGTGDPALTGQLYGLYCMACPVHRFRVQIQPDFDNAVFQGKVSLRGRIRLAAMFFYGLQIITDANVRGLIRRVRNR